jgi:cation transport ATPase
MSNEEKNGEVPMSSTLFHPVMSNRAYQFVSFQVCPDSPQMEQDFLYMLASLEALSDHPMSAQIVKVARANNVLPLIVSAFQRFPERGAGGLITLPKDTRPRAALLGSHAFILKSRLEIPDLLEKTIKSWEDESNSLIMLGGWDGWVRGVVKFQAVPIEEKS